MDVFGIGTPAANSAIRRKVGASSGIRSSPETAREIEDHSDGGNARDILSVVAGAARHQLCGQTQTGRGFLDHLAQPWIDSDAVDMRPYLNSRGALAIGKRPRFLIRPTERQRITRALRLNHSRRPFLRGVSLR